MAIIEMPRKKRGRNKIGLAPYVSVSRTNSSNRCQVVISISKDAMKDLGWVCGDRVKVAYDDESHFITLTRTGTSFGYTLNGRSKENKARGCCVLSSIRFPSTEGIRPVSYTGLGKDDCVINGPSITFVMPGQS